MRFVLLSLAFAFTLVTFTVAEAEEALPAFKPIALTYDVFVGGAHLVTADILINVTGNQYHANVKGQTYGFWHRLLPWDNFIDVRGKIINNNFVPVEFYGRDVWKDKPKITRMHYTKDDVIVEFDPPNTDQGRELVTKEQRHGAYDAVSALLQMLGHLAVYDDCNATVPIFDGKRRFDVIDSDAGDSEIDASDYGMYKGEARACNADFKMIAGEWKDRKPSRFWQKSDTEAGREPFHIWTAKIDPDLPEVAVKLESGSVFGPIIMHLTKWRYASPSEIKVY